jgi:hypothetical protein
MRAKRNVRVVYEIRRSTFSIRRLELDPGSSVSHNISDPIYKEAKTISGKTVRWRESDAFDTEEEARREITSLIAERVQRARAELNTALELQQRGPIMRTAR